MGASPSLAPITEEILDLDAAKVYEPNGLTSRRLHLSKDVLESVRRQSCTISTRRKGSNFKERDIFKLQFAASLKYEVPLHVTEFLDRIGVNDDNKKNTAVSISAGPRAHNRNISMQNEKTTKLVGHIFECLGALQHLVRSNQSDIPSDTVNCETQSTNDMNTKSVGKLLHEMVTIYGLCGDTINALLEADPDAAGVEDTLGRLPLHVCCDRDEPWMDMVTALVEAKPEALNCRDGAGRLPLHIALDRQKPSIEVVRLLVRANPAAAGARRGVGRLPIHYACFSDQPSVDIIQCLLASHPEGAQAVDVYGKLPLHYVADRVEPNLAAILCLLQAYPQGAAVRDTHQRTPLKLAVKQGSTDLRVVSALLKAYPLGASIPGQYGKLPLHAAIECAHPCEGTIRLLASHYPQGVFMITRIPSGAMSTGTGTGTSITNTGLAPVTGPGINQPQGPSTTPSGGLLGIGAKDNCPFQIAMNKNRYDLARVMLLACPTCSALMLADLNWHVRRVAFVVTNFGTPFDIDNDMDMEDLMSLNGMVVSLSPKGNTRSMSRRSSDHVGYFSSPTRILLDDRRRAVQQITNTTHLSKVATARLGCLTLERDSVQLFKSAISCLGSPGGRLAPLIRPTPYARMMGSASYGDRDQCRSFASPGCSPTPPINLLHGLFIVNLDLWRLVITFL